MATYPIPWTHPSSYNTTLRRVLSSTGGPTLRKDAGGGKPSTTRHGVHGAFQSSSSPESPPSFGCSRHGFTAGGPTWIWRLWARAEGSRHARSLGQPIGWRVLPSSVSPMTVHPWEPSLPRLQGCDCSPGHCGLNVIESASLVVYSVFIQSFELSIFIQTLSHFFFSMVYVFLLLSRRVVCTFWR